MSTVLRSNPSAWMVDQDRVSQTSSVSTVSFLQTRDKCHEKVQTFGKRCQAVKRDPNCPVVIRGWLYKKDSTGLKLWKRRWFVLSNYCLYYYKDSREESVLGSIPLPSYRILYCSPRECKNRKYAFKVVHQGMRPYILSAETQEDMLGWVRALSQSASMEVDDIINRRCSSFQDFTQMRDETEMMELQQTPTFPERNTQTAGKLTRAQTEPTLQDQTMMGVKMKTPELRGRHEMRACDPESFQRSQSLGKADEEPFSFLNPKGNFGTEFPRDQYGSQYHGNTARDGWLMENCSSAPLSPCIYTERRHMPDTSFPCAMCYSSNYHTAEHMTLCKTGKSDIVMEREIQPIRDLENDTDVVLTRLCGCDKLLQSFSLQLAQLQADKKNVEYALEMRWLEMEDVVPDEQEVSQKALLQEDLVTLRARICDVSLEMERAWSDYERMESELSVFYSHLQHILHFGMAQEQIQAQRQIWMMEDILCGLRVNKKRFMILLGLQAQTVPHPQTVSYFEEELGAHDMDCVTQLQQQDFMKFHQSYTRNPQEIPGNDNRTTDAPQEPLRLTRVISSTLPTSLIAERVFVEDPEQLSQLSGLKNSKTPKKPSRMLHEMTDKTRHCRWADLPEERLQKTLNQNPIEDNFKHQQQVQLEHKEATYLTNSESDRDLGITAQKWENKIRHVEREDRRLSADKEHFTDDIQRLGLITANEKETDTYKFTPDSSVLHLSNGYTADRRKIQSKNAETASPVTKAHTKSEDMTSRQSSCNDVIVIESHSINHISTLTVFKGHQGKNQTHKPQKKNRSSVSTNLKSECFLSNSRWSEVVPVYRQKPKPQASLLPLENQQIDQPSQNVENILTSVQSKLSPSGAHEGQNGADFQEGQSPKPPNQLQDTQPNQPITTANNQSTCASDQSRLDQCIYEEIQMIPPTLEDVKTHQDNHTAETPQSNATAEDESNSTNHKSAAREEYSTINTEGRRCPEVSKSRTGRDVACKRENGQETSAIKSSVINHHVQDCRPRITVVSTSL